MNQKYLQGISSDMDGIEDAVFFEATPENITAFLMQHQWAAISAIGTVDDRSFLTARTGLIDVCPDQEFLAQKLLPVYAGVQMGHAPIPPLKTVSREIALAEKCPLPDWNYLRWNGYSDEKYQALRSGKGLLEHQQVCLIGTAGLRRMRGYVPADPVDQAGRNQGTCLAVYQPVGVREEVLPALAQPQGADST